MTRCECIFDKYGSCPVCTAGQRWMRFLAVRLCELVLRFSLRLVCVLYMKVKETLYLEYHSYHLKTRRKSDRPTGYIQSAIVIGIRTSQLAPPGLGGAERRGVLFEYHRRLIDISKRTSYNVISVSFYFYCCAIPLILKFWY